MATLNRNPHIFSLIFLCAFTSSMYSVVAYSRTAPTQESLNANFVLMVNKIKHGCNAEHPTDDAAFKICAQSRYDAMHSFYEKMFKYRDAKGIQSKGFLYGLECINKYAPEVNEPHRKYAVELTDWIKANKCYEDALN